jgi:fluoride exporter
MLRSAGAATPSPYTLGRVEDDPTSGPESVARPHHGRWQTGPTTVAAVFLGGMLGAVARYGAGALLPSLGDGFPWDTLVENVAGSLLLGFILVVLVERFGPTSLLRPFLAVGVLGSFTTFSAMAVEGDLLVREGDAALAAVYWSTTVALGLGAALVGIVGALRLLAWLDRPT